MDPKPRKMLGEKLVERGLITERQLELAMREQKRTKAMLGEVLISLGFLTQQALSSALAEQGGVRFVDLAEMLLPPEILAYVPERTARRLLLIPIDHQGQEITLAMANIYDIEAISEIENTTRLRVKVVGASEDDIQAKINEAYGERKSIEELIEDAIQAATKERLPVAGGVEVEIPVVQVVDQLLIKAVRDRATDLHVQPSERTVLTRFRVDGILNQGPSLPKALQAGLITRLKILAEVNIAESRAPQDGKFRLQHGKRAFDVRASFLPAIHGEKVVLRLLDKSKLVMGFDQLGMPDYVFEGFKTILARPHGVILVTGPTGSGKTTTLYSALSSINSSDRCIITVEDPVEYELPLITQVQVNVKAGLSFAAGLRSILRQDPDIILIGEIRDGETAQIAMRAAMTGHLVLSTLHTNDPVSAIPRLLDMGVSRLELAAALQGIHAQRLIRTNCNNCIGPAVPEAEALALIKAPLRPGPWQKGAGCDQCTYSGYRGRRSVHDLLYISPAIRELLAKGAQLADIEAQARDEGKTSLFDHAIRLAQQGVTTLEEAVRITMVEE